MSTGTEVTIVKPPCTTGYRPHSGSPALWGVGGTVAQAPAEETAGEINGFLFHNSLTSAGSLFTLLRVSSAPCHTVLQVVVIQMLKLSTVTLLGLFLPEISWALSSSVCGAYQGTVNDRVNTSWYKTWGH